GLAPFERTATRRILGTASLNSSSCLPIISSPKALQDDPVRFPPGRVRFAMSPIPTGSPTAIMTIGIVSVARLAAVAPWSRVSHDDIHLKSGQLGREVGQSLEPAICKSIVNDKILALNPSTFTKSLAERDEAEIRRSPRPEITYPVDPSIPLRLSGERREN